MKDELKVTVAKNIKKYRKKMKMTQLELAQKINKTVEMVCQVENNIASTKLSTLEDMAKVFNIEPYQLLMAREYPDFESYSPELTDLMFEIQEQPTEFLVALTQLIRHCKK